MTTTPQTTTPQTFSRTDLDRLLSYQDELKALSEFIGGRYPAFLELIGKPADEFAVDYYPTDPLRTIKVAPFVEGETVEVYIILKNCDDWVKRYTKVAGYLPVDFVFDKDTTKRPTKKKIEEMTQKWSELDNWMRLSD